jgi:hypothetical protein
MAQSDEMERLWALAEQLGEARKRQAKTQSAYLKAQEKNTKAHNKAEWAGPTLGGGMSGAMTGFMVGGPVGAAVGAGLGAGAGFLGREKFNENPALLPALGNTAQSMALMNRSNKPAMDYGSYLSENPVASINTDLGGGLSASGTGQSAGYQSKLAQFAAEPVANHADEFTDMDWSMMDPEWTPKRQKVPGFTQ